MPYKVYKREGTVEDVVKTAPTKKECAAFIRRRQDEHMALAREFCSPLALRHAKRFVRRSYRIEKVAPTR